MARDTTGQWFGTPMDDDDVDAILESEGYAVLSLARDDDPYSIPVSLGYDGTDAYFVLLEDGPKGEKFDYIEDGGTVRLLVMDVHSRFDWRSVAVTGTARRVERDTDEWEHLADTMAENAWFTRGFERADSIEDVHGWRVADAEVRGLRVAED